MNRFLILTSMLVSQITVSCMSEPSEASDPEENGPIVINEMVISMLKIDGMRPELESEARALIQSSQGKYNIVYTQNNSSYGVVFLEKYMSDLGDEYEWIKGVPRHHVDEIVQLMNQSIKSEYISKWVILRYRSDGREFVGVYEGKHEHLSR